MTRQNLAPLDAVVATAQRTSSFALHTCVGRRTGRRRHPVHPEMPAKSPACSAAVTPSDAPTSRRPTRLFDRPTVERKRERALSSRPLVCRLFDALDAQLTRNPFASQCVLVAVLACLSDVIAQLLEGSRLPTLDLTRTWRFAAFRALIATPIYLSWLSFMERCVEQRASASRLPSGVYPLLKMCLDQGLYTPTYQGFFYIALATAEGQSLGEGWRRAMHMLPRTMPYAWAFWCPIQACNFWLVPMRWRVLAMNTANVFWNIAMSLFNEIARTSTPSTTVGAAIAAVAPVAPPVAAAIASAAMRAAMADATRITVGGAGARPYALHGAADGYALGGGDQETQTAEEEPWGGGTEECADLWPRRWCRKRAAKCWSEWVLVRCTRSCGLCDETYR